MTPIPWPGGKANLARQFGIKLAMRLPKGSTYYEGFCGAANVGVFLGNLRNDLDIVLTDTDDCLVAALRYLRDTSPDESVDRVTEYVNKLRDLFYTEGKDKVDAVLCGWKYGSAEHWLAAIQCRYPGELSSWNWNPDSDRLKGRLRSLAGAFSFWHTGLANADIECRPAGTNPDAVACYFDPPYYGAKKVYPKAQGSVMEYSQLAGLQRQYSEYILVSDYVGAAPFYERFGFKSSQTGKELGAWRNHNKDAYFEWDSRESSS